VTSVKGAKGAKGAALSVRAADQVGEVAGPLVVATDAANDGRWVGSGYLATSGHYGAHGHPYGREISGAQRTVVAELRAVHAGLSALFRAGAAFGVPVEVRVDSMDALAFLRDWTDGGTALPDGYRLWRKGGATPTLVKLRALVAHHASTLAFCHEKAHAGHILNEAADSLARLGLRCSKGAVGRPHLAPLAQHYAQQNLAAYRRTLTAPGRP
jgi:ribonuclease HI